MQVEEVVDRDTLEAYLKALPDQTRRDTSLRVAFHAAIRVLPIAVHELLTASWAQERDLTRSVIFDAVSISGVARFYRTPEIPDAANAAIAYANAAYAANATTTYAAYAAAYAANAAASVATACANAAAAANSAATAATAHANANATSPAKIDLSDLIRADLERDGPVWPGAAPAEIQTTWEHCVAAMRAAAVDWSFWIAWYHRVLAGRDWHPKMMGAVLENITSEDWNKGPAHINPMFDHVLEIYRAEDAASETPLSKSAPVDFTFDTLHRVMRMIGIDDNVKHLRDPTIVQAFLDDAEQLRDDFRDFVDYANELSPGGNYAGVLRLAAEKVIKEFVRVADLTHLRAERLVLIGGELESFAVSEKGRADLGEPLCGILDKRIAGLKQLCRKHFGPSYQTLAPLADLNLDHVDQDGLLHLFDDAIAFIESLPNDVAPGLDHDGLLVLQDMKAELRTYRAAIAEASSDDFRAMLEDRFAQSAGASGLTLLRFFETSQSAYGKMSDGADEIAKATKRVKTLADIWDVVATAFGGG